MSRSTPKNLVKKLQIATDRKFKCGQIPFESNNPFCICWQELASVFRFNILSVAEEPLRRSVAGKGSKRRQSRLCKLWKWARVRLPPPSTTCDACGELSEGRTGSRLAETKVTWAWGCRDLFQIRYVCSFQVGWMVLFGLYYCFPDDGDFPPDVPQLGCVWQFWHCLGKPRTGREVPELRSQNSCYTASLPTPHC